MPRRVRHVVYIIGVLAVLAGTWIAQPVAASAPSGFSLPFVGGPYYISQAPGCSAFSHKNVREALDILTPSRTTIRAAAAGTVIFRASSGAYGGLIKIRHAGGLVSYYGHLQRFDVALGQAVSKGQAIGLSGGGSNDPMRGTSTGAHLHFEVRDRDGGRTLPITGLTGLNWSSRTFCSGTATGPRLADVGEGSSRQIAFQEAFQRTGKGTTTDINYGDPSGPVQWFNPADGRSQVGLGYVVQRFANAWLVHDENVDNPRLSVPVYPVDGPILQYWLSPAGVGLGAPTSNRFYNGAGQLEQHFRNGYVLSGGTLATTTKGSWPTRQQCANQGLWYMEVRNVLRLPGSSWPPSMTSSAGPSAVVCTTANRDGYAFHFDAGLNPIHRNQGLWDDGWVARVEGTINRLPNDQRWRAFAFCDDGCRIKIDNIWSWFPLQSWRDQGANVSIGRMVVQNGNRVEIDWYENGGDARVWMQLDRELGMFEVLAPECTEAHVSIAGGAAAIASMDTTLTISATTAAEMRVGFLSDLTGISWQPFTTSLALQLPATDVITERSVFVQLRNAEQQMLCGGSAVSDAVLVDPLAPTASPTLMGDQEQGYTIVINGSDQEDGSGVAWMALIGATANEEAGDTPEADSPFWQPYSTTVTVAPADRYYVWVRDEAGNVSPSLLVVGPGPVTPPPSHSVYLPLVRR
ncbi:MAG: M23 family metallopeptidase [Candidatus Viridilinea halotolerans]|uniref:M23 family metallopeptidase n=1 Tax=Candidatus Viridilinea halotolerans TaxID=2491704 RepID=A0A426U9I2_9CHLR|nr:MAG: M23 family metallopeptidase [Candidatus Viridilinea halotolerans]